MGIRSMLDSDLVRSEPDPRTKYQITRLGFGLIAVATSLNFLNVSLQLLLEHPRLEQYQPILSDKNFEWYVRTPLTWFSLAGAYLLWARWHAPTWRRRSGFLLLANLGTLAVWFLRHRADFGLGQSIDSLAWLRELFGFGLRAVQLALIAQLAADVSTHLGDSNARATGRSTASTSYTSLMFLFMVVMLCTRFDTWPPRQRQLWNFEHSMVQMNFRIFMFLIAVSLFRATTACLTAARQCRLVVADLTRALNTTNPNDADFGSPR
jgi:hypothetical protein